jgi:protein-tyrosine phosphatase
MIDLHCHILPGIDDGASDLSVSLAMARQFVDDGVTVVACTSHILPGLYNNSGDQIRRATDDLRLELQRAGIELELVTGADAHICPDFVSALKSGRILSLADTRYVLVEPPHHVAPQRMEQFFFDILVAGYVPILTHPERLRWLSQHYDVIKRMTGAGMWNQITSSSLTGAFGKTAQYWAERMLDEGLVHILASDAHDVTRRVPNLSRGRDAAARRLGELEAQHLVFTRPRGVLSNDLPSELPAAAGVADLGIVPQTERASPVGPPGVDRNRSWGSRLRSLFE